MPDLYIKDFWNIHWLYEILNKIDDFHGLNNYNNY